MTTKYRVFELKQSRSVTPDGSYETTNGIFALTQTGNHYHIDFDTHEEAVNYIMGSGYENCYTILPIFIKD